jgi:hypothetical protein
MPDHHTCNEKVLEERLAVDEDREALEVAFSFSLNCPVTQGIMPRTLGQRWLSVFHAGEGLTGC